MVKNEFIYLNSGPMVEDLFFKHGSEDKWKVQMFTFIQVGGLGGLG